MKLRPFVEFSRLSSNDRAANLDGLAKSCTGTVIPLSHKGNTRMSLLLATLILAANPAAAPAETAVEPVKTKKICKVDPGLTGSRMKKKLCLTETEWAQRTAGKNAGDLKTIGGR